MLGISLQLTVFSSYEDQVILSIVRDLNEDTILPVSGLLVKDIIISCCIRSIEGLDVFQTELDAGLYSIHILYPLFNSATTLIHFLHIPVAHGVFAQTCRQLMLLSKDFAFTGFLLQTIKTLAEQLNIEIPEQAIPYFASLRFTYDELREVPLSFVAPDHGGVLRRLRWRFSGATSPELQLGTIITNWGGASVN